MAIRLRCASANECSPAITKSLHCRRVRALLGARTRFRRDIRKSHEDVAAEACCSHAIKCRGDLRPARRNLRTQVQER